ALFHRHIGAHAPMDPPIAIICKWRPLSLRASGEFAVLPAAASASNTLPLAPTAPTGVACWVGSRLKVAKNRPTAPLPSEAVSPYTGGDGDGDASVVFSTSPMTT